MSQSMKGFMGARGVAAPAEGRAPGGGHSVSQDGKQKSQLGHGVDEAGEGARPGREARNPPHLGF